MTCPRCARDLLALALDAQARGDTAAIAQPLREAITEWSHEGEARAMTGMLARWEKLGTPPDLAYWLGVANGRVSGKPVPKPTPTVPCKQCPGNK